MTINIQLVEVPENEQVDNRQVALPEHGGTIGRAYNCTLQLPDFNRQLSRVHAEITRSPQGGYQVTDQSTNGLLLNGQLLGRGRHQRISDGDTLKVGGYTLLISDMSSMFAGSPEPEPTPETVVCVDRAEPVFNMDSMQADEMDWPLDGEQSASAGIIDKASVFSTERALADDQFSHDPFDDDYEIERPNTRFSSSGITLDHPANNSERLISDSLARLTQLMEQQQKMQAESYRQDKLMQCLQRALDRFLEEQSPCYLEEIFKDYVSGWGSREKKYWQLYCKQFKRKQDRKEFYHRFTALFIEEMRGTE